LIWADCSSSTLKKSKASSTNNRWEILGTCLEIFSSFIEFPVFLFPTIHSNFSPCPPPSRVATAPTPSLRPSTTPDGPTVPHARRPSRPSDGAAPIPATSGRWKNRWNQLSGAELPIGNVWGGALVVEELCS
jgi:hypothetical protein